MDNWKNPGKTIREIIVYRIDHEVGQKGIYKIMDLLLEDVEKWESKTPPEPADSGDTQPCCDSPAKEKCEQCQDIHPKH